MNLLELKRSAMGYTFQCGGGDDGSNAGGGSNIDVRENADAGSNVNIDHRENPSGGTTPTGDPSQDYINNLRESQEIFIKNNVGEGEAPTQSLQTMEAKYTPEQAVDLYNRMDPALASDPVMLTHILRGKDYWKEEGDFTPGSDMTTADNLKSGMKQWKADDEKMGRNMWMASLAALAAFTGGAALAGAPAAGGAAAAGAAEAGTGASMGAMSAGEAAAGNAALASQLSPYLAAEAGGAEAGGAAAGGAVAAGGGGGSSGGLVSSANQFLGTPVGKFAASQGVGALASAMKGDGGGQQSGLINSNQQSQKSQPNVVNYYSQPAPTYAVPAQKTIAPANASMYGSGSGWGSSISKYQKSKVKA